MASTKSKTAGRRKERGGAEGVLNAAIQTFAARGYHGTSVRDLAVAQGLTVAALYYHFDTKYDVLVAIMTRAMDDIIADTEQARDQADADPASRLAAMVRAHVLFHTHRQAESFVGNSELRSLEGDDLAGILRRRDDEEGMFLRVIQEGRDAGSWSPEFPRECARAILAMCIHVSTWFRADGGLSPDEVADRYVGLALHVVGAHANTRRKHAQRSSRR